MPVLTRRRDPVRKEECWRIYYGDMHIGTISKIASYPAQWEWRCGFYPGSEPGEHKACTAATFDGARADFGAAWRVFLAKRTKADFQAWRDQRDWTARKYAMWERGEKLPSQQPNSTMRCPCGKLFDSHRLEHSLIHVPHITDHEREIRCQSTVR
jgi:hypothetical protein